jgi:hypothetical protein
MQLPNLAGVATNDLVETIGGGNFKASYINWSRTLNLLREHAPGWLPETVPNSEGGLLHAAPVGCYLLIRFRNGEQTTPAVPQAVMDPRNAAIPHDKITARDLTDTHRRGICLAAAMTFGLAYELWAKLPLESGYDEDERDAKTSRQSAPKPPAAPPPPPAAINVEKLIAKINSAATRDFLNVLWQEEIRQMPRGKDYDRVVAAANRRSNEIKTEEGAV